MCLQKRAERVYVGIDSSPITANLALMTDAKIESIDPILWQMRRVKGIDELALMQEAINAAAAMYDHARKIIEPGISEIDMFTQLQQVAVQTTREPMTAAARQ